MVIKKSLDKRESHNFFYMLQGIIYFILTLSLEVLPLHKINLATACQLWTSSKKLFLATSGSSLEPLLASSSEDHEDIDVLAERNRVLSGSGGNALIYLHNLRKVQQHAKICKFLSVGCTFYLIESRNMFCDFRCIQEGSRMVQKLLFIH